MAISSRMICSIFRNKILQSSEDKQTTTITNNMDDSHQQNMEQKEPKKQTNEDSYVLHNSIFIKLETGKTNLFCGRTQDVGTFVQGR